MGINRTQYAEAIKAELRQRFDRRPDIKDRYAIIRCPNLDHKGGEERRGSLQIWLDPAAPGNVGRWKCRTCNISGQWPDLARRLNLRTFEDQKLDWGYVPLVSEQEMQRRISGGLSESTRGLEWPKEQDWRGISGEFIHRFGGRIDTTYGPRLRFPVTVRRKVRGMVHALIDSKMESDFSPKYRNDAGPWVLNYGLFGFDTAKEILRNCKYRILWLGEGPRDAMNPQQYDYPAIGMLGSLSQWTIRKAELLRSLDLDLLVILTDPDKAGDDAAEVVTRDMEGHCPLIRYGLRRDPVTNKKLEDLGELKPDHMQYIWEKCLDIAASKRRQP